SSVSSLRRDKQGSIKQDQVAGGMHPGNSGGPVVDSQGRVVGVAVSVLRNTQINFAIPGERVHVLLNGRLGVAVLGDPIARNKNLLMPVRIEVIDPLNRLPKI